MSLQACAFFLASSIHEGWSGEESLTFLMGFASSFSIDGTEDWTVQKTNKSPLTNSLVLNNHKWHSPPSSLTWSYSEVPLDNAVKSFKNLIHSETFSPCYTTSSCSIRNAKLKEPFVITSVLFLLVEKIELAQFPLWTLGSPTSCQVCLGNIAHRGSFSVPIRCTYLKRC